MCRRARLGKLVTIEDLSSAKQLDEWLDTVQVSIRFNPINEIVANIVVKGPATGKLLEGIKKLQLEYHNLA
ncbi:hypothetical protein [Pricia antarctica]|uniref:hypothetical protein n=1 Tax=Pricia antarctica TaxID=641691 RepID=UPI001113ED26|nr:hypothetical protein [Pricia antarctica]